MLVGKEIKEEYEFHFQSDFEVKIKILKSLNHLKGSLIGPSTANMTPTGFAYLSFPLPC